MEQFDSVNVYSLRCLFFVSEKELWECQDHPDCGRILAQSPHRGPQRAVNSLQQFTFYEATTLLAPFKKNTLWAHK